MSATSSDTSPPIRVHAGRHVQIPVALLWSIVITAALCGGYVYTLSASVEHHSREIKSLQEDARASRELLVRIDENVKSLKERVAR